MHVSMLAKECIGEFDQSPGKKIKDTAGLLQS